MFLVTFDPVREWGRRDAVPVIQVGARPFRDCFKTEVYVSRLSLFSLVLVAGVGAALVGCGSDDDSSTAGGGSGGKCGTGAGGAAAGGADGASTLYSRLGGHEGIKAAIGAIVTAELADDDIASFFAPNLTATHTPQPADIVDCFTALLGNAAGGPEVYPYKTAGGFTCRSMAAAHADLHIGSGTFDNFVGIAAGVLKDAGVADADIAVIGGVLNGTKSTIVDADAPPNGPCVSSACEVNAPGEGGAAGSN